jgi:transposase-like protein
MSNDTILTGHMKAYLAERHKYGSNAACARAIGFSPNTLYRWRKESEDFLEAEVRMTTAVDTAISDPDTFVYEKLRPQALQRMDEILAEPITSTTENSRMNYIRQAATEVLKGTGDLRPDGTGAGIAVIINNFRAKGGEYTPSWKRSPIIDID